jgi:hypothetical protein
VAAAPTSRTASKETTMKTKSRVKAGAREEFSK